MTREQYPILANFVAAWLHQDFDLNGENLADILAEYKCVTPRGKLALLRSEVTRFQTEHPHDMEQALERIFSPEVSVTGMCGSAEAFLREIQRILTDP